MNPKISFEASVDESFGPARELLCSVWPLAKDGEQLSIGAPVFCNRTVLVGPHRRGNDASVLELPKAGAYLIDLGYPNGMSLRTTVSVTDGEQYRLVVQNLGPDSCSASIVAPTAGGVPRVLSAALKTIHLQAPDLEIKTVAQPQGVSLQCLREFASDIKEPSMDTEILARVSNADLTFSIQLPSIRVPDFRRGYLRKWLVVAGEGKHQTMVAYPFGWLHDDGDVFRLSMRRKTKNGGEATKWSVGLKLMDPVYGSMIEHLNRRDVQSSNVISQSMRGQATTALYEKEGNPFAAAAAAYLFALDREDSEHRQQWVANLSSWYDWLPDGAIALGWKLLREGRRGSSAWRESRDLFVLACSRGLPYYTVGLHLLVEAFTLLSMADPDDTIIRDLLAAARAADVACVRSEPFTTLQVSRFLGLPVQ